jgi:hypothetical protein
VSSQHASGSRDVHKARAGISRLTHIGMASRSRSAVCEPNCSSVEGTELDTQELSGGSWTRVGERETGVEECEHVYVARTLRIDERCALGCPNSSCRLVSARRGEIERAEQTADDPGGSSRGAHNYPSPQLYLVLGRVTRSGTGDRRAMAQDAR